MGQGSYFRQRRRRSESILAECEKGVCPYFPSVIYSSFLAMGLCLGFSAPAPPLDRASRFFPVHLDFLPHEYFVRRVYIPFDLPGFHDPLADYAFVAILHGRFPEWDPSNYGVGMPFAANPGQVALFYPGTWIMFAANSASPASFVLDAGSFRAPAYLDSPGCCASRGCAGGVWEGSRAACGATISACGGYMMMNLQHLGVIAGCAWIPLGLWGHR